MKKTEATLFILLFPLCLFGCTKGGEETKKSGALTLDSRSTVSGSVFQVV